MTIRMQESEAAANFQQFLAHLRAGDQVELENGAEPPVTVTGRAVPSRSADAEQPQSASISVYGREASPITAEAESEEPGHTGDPCSLAGDSKLQPARGSMEALLAFRARWAHVFSDPEYQRSMREARSVFNEPWEPRAL